jgi:DNA sulfur modification protein DndE
MRIGIFLSVVAVFSQLCVGHAFGLPFDMPRVNIPTFKTDTFNIEKYGARGDGMFLNTEAIAKAIDACSNNGGGVVLIPSGVWITGPVVLKNNVNLCVKRGALLQFSTNKDHYPLVDGYYEGAKSKRCQSPISGVGLMNIAITGGGVIDGAGHVWRSVKKDKLTESQWKDLIKYGGLLDEKGKTWYPSEKYRKGELIKGMVPKGSPIQAYEDVKDFFRPVLLSLIECKNILLDGPTFQNSPNWGLHPLMCEHITVRNIRVYNPEYAQNGDALDLESCRIGTIDNCVFDAGDDAICLKSGKNEEGRKRGKPTELFVITNCLVYHGHGGFVVGSEMSGGVRNIFVDNCTFMGTDIGLRFKSSRERGGVVENIWISNISMSDIATEAVSFNMYYGGKSPKETDNTADVEDSIPAVNDGTPQFRNLYIRNVQCNGAARAILAQGLPEMSIQNIMFENVSICANEGISVIDAENISMKNVSVKSAKGHPIWIKNGKKISLEAIHVPEGQSRKIKISGTRNSAINIDGKNVNSKTGEVDF